MKSRVYISNFIRLFVLLALFQISNPLAYSLSKKGSAIACLKASEEVVKACSFPDGIREDSRASKRRSKRCEQAKKKEKVVCNVKRLKCNEFDINVCGVTNPCTTRICKAVVSKQLTFDNVCALKKASAEFKFRGKCGGEEEEPTCNDKSRAVCGQPLNTCAINANSTDDLKYQCDPLPPQWYANICELNKEGATKLADEVCASSCPNEKNPVPVCGKPKITCVDPKICPAANPMPIWYQSKCDLIKNDAIEVSPIECSADECPTQVQVCGEQVFDCKGTGCPLNIAKPFPKLFVNRCQMTQENNREVPISVCQDLACSRGIKKQVCGVINPPPCVYSNLKIACQARPSSIGWYNSECELLKAGATLVPDAQCPQQVF